MALEPEFAFINIEPPNEDWLKENAISPARIAVWPAKLFREAVDVDGTTTDFSLDDHVVLAYDVLCGVDEETKALTFHRMALLLPVGVSRELAKLILGLHGGAPAVGSGT